MCSNVNIKPKLEDVLFLHSPVVSQNNATKLANLTQAFNEKKSNSNLRKLQTEMNTSKKHLYEKISDDDMEKMITDDLRGQYYPGFVKYFKSNYQDSLDKSMKSAQKSGEMRIQANELFAKENHDFQEYEDIWRLYSKSIAFAPVGSKELVLAYECRSNLLLHYKKFESCIKDIDRALSITKFHLLRVKLLCRKMTCFVAMNKNVDEKKVIWSIIKDEFGKITGELRDEKFSKMVVQAKTDSSSQPIKFIETVQPTLLNASPKLLTPFSNIALVGNKEIHVIANRDFISGEEVIVTKPIITSANPDRSYAYCSHCLSLMWAGIPCNECSLCMYCSEECKGKAWQKYHIVECKVLPHINFDDIIYFDLQTTVKVFILGLREFGSISKLKQEVDKLRDNPRLLKKDKLFDSDFLNFYVRPIISENNLKLLAQYAKNACFLIAYMIESCDVFEQDLKLLRGKELSKNKDIVFCGIVLLKLLILSENNMNYTEPLYTTIIPCSRCSKNGSQKINIFKRCCRRGKAFHPFQTMFEKSCNPNIAGFWTDDGQMIYLCVQPIKKFEKIVYRKGIEFYDCKRDLRDKLFTKHPKVCQCVPCTKDWPSMTELYKKFQQRQSKSEKKETQIVQKYLKKNKMKINPLVLTILTEKEFQEFVKDVNDVVKVCGQPSFASSFMISILCVIYEEWYGTHPIQCYMPLDHNWIQSKLKESRSLNAPFQSTK